MARLAVVAPLLLVVAGSLLYHVAAKSVPRTVEPFGAVIGVYATALLASVQYRTLESVASALGRQLGAIGAAALLALLVYSAWRGDFVHGAFFGGAFGAASVGRVLLAHDALATEAVAAVVLVGLAGAVAAWRLRERAR